MGKPLGITCKGCGKRSFGIDAKHPVCFECRQLTAFCPMCMAVMPKYAAKGHLRKTCSRKCSIKLHHKKITLLCETCGQPFMVNQGIYQSSVKRNGYPPRFCSRECHYTSPRLRSAIGQKTKERHRHPEWRAQYEAAINKRNQSDEWKTYWDSVRGENNPNWKGGVVRERTEAMRRQRYKAWRKTVFVRDQYTCQGCGAKNCKLYAHHIKHWSEYPELRYTADNGITYCHDCHNKAHGWQRREKTYLCENCGNPKKDRRGKYCRRCANIINAHSPKLEPRICPRCGLSFQPKRSNRKYCSQECFKGKRL